MNHPPSTVGEPPVTAEQTVAALELVARFERAVDRRDGAAFASLFTDDGRITGSMQANRNDVTDRIQRDSDGPPLAHLTANHIVSAHGAGGLQIEYVLVVLALDGASPRILRVNQITDDLVSTPDGWRVRRHDVADFTADGVGTR